MTRINHENRNRIEKVKRYASQECDIKHYAAAKTLSHSTKNRIISGLRVNSARLTAEEFGKKFAQVFSNISEAEQKIFFKIIERFPGVETVKHMDAENEIIDLKLTFSKENNEQLPEKIILVAETLLEMRVAVVNPLVSAIRNQQNNAHRR